MTEALVVAGVGILAAAFAILMTSIAMVWQPAERPKKNEIIEKWMY